jgi:hypothetical protein
MAKVWVYVHFVVQHLLEETSTTLVPAARRIDSRPIWATLMTTGGSHPFHETSAVHTNEKTEQVPSAADQASEKDRPTSATDDPTEFERPDLTEPATVVLPEAVAPAQDPPTVALPDPDMPVVAGAAPPVQERTELMPVPEPVPPTAVVEPDLEAATVADKRTAAARRVGPAKVPGYELIDRLGAGTYGEVWLAQEERTGIRVAIKFLNHDTGIEWQLIQAEVKQLALLHTDPGIVQLLDVELESRPPYYIMAYAEDGSLARRLEQGPLPLAEALDIFKQLAEALAYVHAKGVRHCDLKPGNVLLKARKRVLIADFGQSQLSSSQLPALGTFFYMAPEQADLSKQIPDTRWDVYGLGAIFYVMLTGQPPRGEVLGRDKLERITDLSERLKAYRESVQKAPKPDKHRGVAGMDRRLAEIIDRCLEVDPVRRLRDAGAVLAALTRRERLLRQRTLLVFGFVAQVLLCALVGGLGFWGVQAGIQHAEEALTDQMVHDPAGAAVVDRTMQNLRWEMIGWGVGITVGVALMLSALWGWLIWTLRRKDRLQQ